MGAFALALAGGLGPVAPPPPDPPAVVLVVPSPIGKPVDFAAFDSFVPEFPAAAAPAKPAPKAEPPLGWVPPKPDDRPPPQPSAPVKVTLFDAAGQGWEHADAAYLQSWVDARNAQIRAVSSPAAAPSVYGGAACSGGSCQPSGRGLFGGFFRRGR